MNEYKSPYKEIGVKCDTASPRAVIGRKEVRTKVLSQKERKRLQAHGKRICSTCWGRKLVDGPWKMTRVRCPKCKGKGMVKA